MPITRLRHILIAIIAFSLGIDYLVYGTVYPLAMYSPAHIQREEELSMLGACYALGVLVSTFSYAYFSEHLGCRRPMIAGSLILGAATALVAVAPSLPAMIIARIVQGIAAGITWTAGLSIVAEHYPRKRVEMMGFAFMGSTTGSVAGPTLAGWLYDVGGYQVPFIVALSLIALNVFFLFRFLPRDTTKKITVPHLQNLLSDPAIIAPAFALFVAAAAWGILEPVAPLLLSKQNIGPPFIGMILTAATLTYGASAPLVSLAVKKWGSSRTMLIGAIGMALTIPLAGLAPQVLLLAASLCIVNVMFAMTLNPASAAMGDAIEARGLNCYTTIYAVYSIVYSFGQIGSSTLATLALGHINLMVTLIGFSAIIILSIPLMMKLAVRQKIDDK